MLTQLRQTTDGLKNFFISPNGHVGLSFNNGGDPPLNSPLDKGRKSENHSASRNTDPTVRKEEQQEGDCCPCSLPDTDHALTCASSSTQPLPRAVLWEWPILQMGRSRHGAVTAPCGRARAQSSVSASPCRSPTYMVWRVRLGDPPDVLTWGGRPSS